MKHDIRTMAGLAAALFVTVAGWGCESEKIARPGTGGSPARGGNGTGGARGALASGSGGTSSSTGGFAVTGTGGVSPASTGGGGSGSGGSAAGGVPGSGGAAGKAVVDAGVASDAGGDPRVLLSVLSKFTAPDVPAMGLMEAPPMPRNYTGTVPTRPGNGLAQHPMLYVGENYDRILLTNGGKVIWTYDTKGGYELDDIWLLSNGNVLYSHMTYVEEVTPTKQVVWHYTPPNGEIHTCQPIGLDKVLVGLNQNPTPKLQLINKKTMAIEMEHALPDGSSNVVHTQMRRMRMTAAGTYLVGFLDKGKVVEYDSAWNPVWTFATSRPWSVARLHNGNTLIQDESESTCKEVDPKGTVVWSFKKSDISVPGATVGGNTQSCERLASGNTVMLLHSSAGSLQAVEVTKTKQIVWALEDWKDLGDATSAQFLDEPGMSEVPGSTEH